MAIKTKEFVKIQLKSGERSRPLVKWCEENIGPFGTHRWDFNFVGSNQDVTFEFTRSKDAVLFALKWL